MTSAQIIGDRTLNVVQPVQLRAPEVMLFYPWGAAIDIWSVGCLVCKTDVYLYYQLTWSNIRLSNTSPGLHSLTDLNLIALAITMTT